MSPDSEYCAACGEEIPEGSHTCLNCRRIAFCDPEKQMVNKLTGEHCDSYDIDKINDKIIRR